MLTSRLSCRHTHIELGLGRQLRRKRPPGTQCPSRLHPRSLASRCRSLAIERSPPWWTAPCAARDVPPFFVTALSPETVQERRTNRPFYLRSQPHERSALTRADKLRQYGSLAAGVAPNLVCLSSSAGSAGLCSICCENPAHTTPPRGSVGVFFGQAALLDFLWYTATHPTRHSD